MSATIVELADGANGQVAEDRRTLRRIFTVDSSSALTVVDVLALSGIPVYGDAHPLEAAQICHNVSALPDDGGYGWLVTAEYASKVNQQIATSADSLDPASDSYIGSGFPAGGIEGWASDDPCREKWHFELGYERVERQAHQMLELDAADNPLALTNPSLNTALRLTKGGIKESIYVPVISLSKSVPDAWITPTAACVYQGSVNTLAVAVAGFTIPKYGASMRTFSIRRGYWGKTSTPFWEVRVEILCPYIPFADEKALMLVLQQDVVDKNGKPLAPSNGVLSVGLLGADGLTTAVPYYRRFRPSSITSWAGLLLPKKV